MSNRAATLALAVRDLSDGLKSVELWGLLGWQDIRQRYRRSVLGPFWMTISTGVMILTLGILYAKLFGVPVAEYLPFVAIGLVVWTLLSALIIESCSVFTASEHVIKQIRLPISTHVCRIVWRNFIIFFHNAIILVIVALVYRRAFNAQVLLIPLALCLIAANGLWVGLSLGILCTRFRDIPPIIQSLVQVAFFVTPIMWKPEILGVKTALIDFNPLYHFIEVVRAPLLGDRVGIASWIAIGLTTLIGWLLTIAIMARYRHRVAYWI
jgi:ABC-type polysaccharide/polyol phosphate export permease